MPSTPDWGIPYPASSDAVEVWSDLQAMAESVDTLITFLNGKINAIDDWTTFTPTLYNNSNSGTPASIAKTVTRAGYWRLGAGAGSIIIAQAEVIASAAASNGAALTLPIAASERWLIAGSAVISGASPPAGQIGHAYMGGAQDRIHCVTATNAFLDVTSGYGMRYLAIYKAAS